MTCKEFEELSGAFALGALTPEEREAAQSHIAQCPGCTLLYQQLRSVVALLPLSVPQVEPPAELEARVLAAIRREAAAAAEPMQRTMRERWVTRLLAVAAILLLTLLGGISLFTFSLGQQLAGTRQQLANVSPQLMATIQGSPTARQATGELFYLPQQNITVLVVHGLPQLAGTHVYQGWLLFVRGKQITGIRSVGLLTLEGNSASVSFPGNVTSSYNTAAISLEPGPAPSKNVPAGPVVAIGPVQH